MKPAAANVDVGPSGLVQSEAVTIEYASELRQQRVLEEVTAVLGLKSSLGAVKERDRTLLGVVAARVQQAIWSSWVAVEPARPLLRTDVVAAGGQLAGCTERGEVTTAQVYQLELPANAKTCDVPLLQVTDRD